MAGLARRYADRRSRMKRSDWPTCRTSIDPRPLGDPVSARSPATMPTAAARATRNRGRRASTRSASPPAEAPRDSRPASHRIHIRRARRPRRHSRRRRRPRSPRRRRPQASRARAGHGTDPPASRHAIHCGSCLVSASDHSMTPNGAPLGSARPPGGHHGDRCAVRPARARPARRPSWPHPPHP